MTMTTLHTRALTILAFVAIGCGSAADDAGSGDAGHARDAGSIVVPAECEASGAGSISSEMNVQFVNQSDATLVEER